MNRTTWLRNRSRHRRPPGKARLHVEQLETRNLLSSTLGLTTLVQVSGDSPLPPFVNPAPPTPPKVFNNSEVEPQIAVDPTNTDHAVAIWQQDRFRSGGGARGLVVSVTTNASASGGATWSAPAAIPGFDSTNAAGAAFARYTDPWVSIAPNGDVYASAIALTITGGFPTHTAVMVSKSTDGGFTWSTPTTLIDHQAPADTLPIDFANDKEMVVADPTDLTGQTAYVVWDRIEHPGDEQDFDAFHSNAFREDALFSRTTDGGVTWSAPLNLTNFQKNVSALGNEIVVQPGGTVIDVFPHLDGSNKQPPQAQQNQLAVVRSTDHGVTWGNVIIGPDMEFIPVTDPNTGAAERVGASLSSVAVDPNNGNLYAVWADARFSNFTHDDIAFSMSTDGGLTWSTPIKINQTPTTISAGNQQAWTPVVSVNSSGTVAVGYYDFRNPDGVSGGLPTDFWLVHADGNFTDPGSWTSGELRMTNTSFNMENAPPTSRGAFLGDYEGLAAAGTSFYALFGQAGADSTDPSNIWFRDPPPASETTASTQLSPSSVLTGFPGIAGTSLLDDSAAPGAGIVNAPPRETRALPETFRAASQFFARPEAPTLAANSASFRADLLSSGADTKAVDDFFAQDGDQSD